MLHLVTDRTLIPDDRSLVDAVASAVEAGVDAVHLRDPAASARALFALGVQLRDAIQGRAALIVNDRLDVAAALGALGAQLAGRSLALADARRAAPGLKLGVSVHDLSEAESNSSADWLLVGTVFPTRSHPGRPGAGLELISSVSRLVRTPVIAIGGIDASNVRSVIGAGAAGVAVISSILGSSDPAAATRALRCAMEEACSSP